MSFNKEHDSKKVDSEAKLRVYIITKIYGPVYQKVWRNAYFSNAHNNI